MASLVALLSITFGTIYQKRFGSGIDWRPGMLIQYATAGILFALGAMAFETRIVHWTSEFLFALCWLVIVLSFGAIWLLYFLVSPVCGDASREPFLPHSACDSRNGMGAFQRATGGGSASRHGILRYRRISRELANHWEIAVRAASGHAGSCQRRGFDITSLRRCFDLPDLAK